MSVQNTENVKEKTVVKSNKGLIILVSVLIVIILGLVGLLLFKNVKSADSSDVQAQMMIDTRATEGSASANPIADRNVTFVGFDATVLEPEGTILLENLPENQDFLMKFIIKDLDTDKVVFETDLIPSGSHVLWKPSENLEKGEHHLAFMQTPFYPQADGNYLPLTAGNNEVTLTIQ